MGLEKGLNIMLGLSIVRASPYHGTAIDIARKGFSDSASLERDEVSLDHLMEAA